jgi:uncharacterized protein
LSVYLDASVILPLFIADTFSQQAEALIANNSDSIVVSDWAVLEVSNIIKKSARIGDLTIEQADDILCDFDKWRSQFTTAVLLDSRDLNQAIDLVRHKSLAVRGPDALHLAIAIRLNAILLTFDKGMTKAAQTIGLSIAH